MNDPNLILYMFQILLSGEGMLLGLVDYDYLISRVILPQRRLYSLAQHFFAIIGGEDNADLSVEAADHTGSFT